MLKIYRRISPGEHPEAEMGRYLTDAGLRPCAAAVRRRRPHRCRWHAASRSPWRSASSAIKAMPGRGCSTSCTRALTDLAPTETRRDRGGRSAGGLRGRRCRDRPAARRNACGAGARTSEAGVRAENRRRGRCRAVGGGTSSSGLPRPSMRIAAGTNWRARSGSRTRERSARSARQRCRRGRRLAKSGVGHADDAHPRRFSSRSGAGGERRRLHHRLRGRAGDARSPSGAPRPARCAMSPVCCVPSTMPARRWSSARASAPCRSDEAQRDHFIAQFRLRASQAFLRGYWEARAIERRAGRAGSARSLPDREGGLRDRLRGRQPADLDRRSAARIVARWSTRIIDKDGGGRDG